MKNDEPPPPLSEPELFRRAFGDKARDPADVASRMVELDERNPRFAAYSFDVDMSWFLIMPVPFYLVGLIPGFGWAFGFAFVIWAIGVLTWTPWIIGRVAGRRPRQDVAHAVALLGYGLIAWPIGLGVALLVGAALGLRDPSYGLAFPLVFAPGAAAMILALRDRRPVESSVKHGLFLAGGALAYAAVAAALARYAVRPLALEIQREGLGDWPLLGLFLAVALTLLNVWPAAALSIAAVRSWRGRVTAATP